MKCTSTWIQMLFFIYLHLGNTNIVQLPNADVHDLEISKIWF